MVAKRAEFPLSHPIDTEAHFLLWLRHERRAPESALHPHFVYSWYERQAQPETFLVWVARRSAEAVIFTQL